MCSIGWKVLHTSVMQLDGTRPKNSTLQDYSAKRVDGEINVTHNINFPFFHYVQDRFIIAVFSAAHCIMRVQTLEWMGRGQRKGAIGKFGAGRLAMVCVRREKWGTVWELLISTMLLFWKNKIKNCKNGIVNYVLVQDFLKKRQKIFWWKWDLNPSIQTFNAVVYPLHHRTLIKG